MSLPQIVNRDEWLAARTALLEQEKELTRRRDALSADRRRLPMVEITKDYRFTGPQGEVGLIDLFEGRQQLIVGHFMFDPELGGRLPELLGRRRRDVARPAGAPAHPRHDARLRLARAAGEARALEGQEGLGRRLVLVRRQRLQLRLRRHHRRRAGAPSSYNFRPIADEPALAESEQPYEMPGTSVFLRVDDRVFHTYSSYARGAEQTGGSYYFLDLTALGRQEDWEEPKGRADSARAAQPDFAS